MSHAHPNHDEEIEEAVIIERESLQFKAKDEDLIEAIDNAVKEAKPLVEIMRVAGRRNKKYWQEGTDVDMEDIHPKRAKIVDNRIFMATETVIPRITARPPEPSIIGKMDSVAREDLTKALIIDYDVNYKMQGKLRKAVRSWMINFLGVWKYRNTDDGFETDFVKTKNIGIDPEAPTLDDAEFIYEWLEQTVEDMIDAFPDKEDDILKHHNEKQLSTKVRYLEFWGGNGEWVAWKYKDILLDKIKNPNFLYEKKKKKKGKKKGKNDEKVKFAKKGNLWKKPKPPYIFLNDVFNLGNDVFDDSSLITQTIPLQDGVNKRKQQISDLAEDRKKLIIVGSSAMTKEQFQIFINKYGFIGLYLDGTDVTNIKIEAGEAPAWFFEDMNHSISEIDNVFGTHSTTRGEREKQETLGGRKLLLGADLSRLDPITRAVEQFLEDWYNANLQMKKVYGFDNSEFSNGEETVIVDSIPDGIKVRVKEGSTLAIDKPSRAQQAGQLATAGMIDPTTLFEELGYSKPEERAQKLFQWLSMTGKINPEAVGGGAQQGGAQLARLKQMMGSPEFKKLPKERQKEMITAAREVTKRIRGGK